MEVSNATKPLFLFESTDPGYYKQGRAFYENGVSLTKPLKIAALNGISTVLVSLQENPEAVFSISKGSCANSSEEYVDRQRQHGTCLSTCHEPSTLFLPFNLEPCIEIATISMLIEDGAIEITNSSYIESAVDSLGIGDLTAWDGSKVLTDVAQCAVSSCDNSSIGTCSPSVYGLNGITVNAENLQDISQRLSGFCDGVDATLNPDIAGPGVSAWY